MPNKWANLAINYGHHLAGNYTDAMAANVNADLDKLWSDGFRRIRLVYAGSNSSQGTIDKLYAVAAQIKAKGFWLQWGFTLGAGPKTLTDWIAHEDFYKNTFVPWVMANGYVDELSIGNEEELHIDGTTITRATMRSRMRTLATDIKALGYTGIVIYNSTTNGTMPEDWKTEGWGDIDRVYFQFYDVLENFNRACYRISKLFPGKSYCSEWGSAVFQTYNDEYDWYYQAKARLHMLRDNGFTYAYYFCFTDGWSGVTADSWAVKLANGSYRLAYQALLGIEVLRNPTVVGRYYVTNQQANCINVNNSASTAFSALGKYTWVGRTYFSKSKSSSVDGILMFKGSNGVSGIQIFMVAGKFNFQERKTMSTMSTTGSPVIENLNRWFDWVVTYDGTNQLVVAYFNGRTIPFTNPGSFSWADVTDDANPMRFGNTASSENMDGGWSEALMYNRILTREEILNYSKGVVPSSPVLHLPLTDNGTTTSLTDLSGNGNVATVTTTSQIQYAPAKLGPNVIGTKSLNFYTTSNSTRLVVNNDAKLNNLTALTVEGFACIYKPTLNTRIVAKSNSGNRGFDIHTGGGGTRLTFGVGNGTTMTSDLTDLPAVGKWFHFVLCYDGAKVYSFVNGKIITAGGKALTGDTGDDGNTLDVGNAAWANNLALAGSVQGVRYSNICRYTQNFIVPNTLPAADANTILLLNLNEGTGTPVDTSGNNLTVSLAGSPIPYWSNGGLVVPGTTVRKVAINRKPRT